MALRAGYVGIKKRLLDVLKTLPKSVKDGFENQIQLLKDTVGWIGENKVNGIGTAILVNSSTGRSLTYNFKGNFVKDGKYVLSFNRSDVSGFAGSSNLRVQIYKTGDTETKVLTSIVVPEENGQYEYEFESENDVENATIQIYIRSSESSPTATATISDIKLINTPVSSYLENLPTGSEILIAEHTENTTNYAWITPKDADNNALDPTTDTILSMIGQVNMAGSPPYYASFAIAVDTTAQDSPEYMCKLVNTQTNQAAPDGVYTVTYRVAFVRKTQ